MPKLEGFQDLPLEPRREGEELWRWLYEQVRRAILDRRLRPGTRVPSTRNLARQYGVSRGTVVVAFESLLSEGYLEARTGAGTFVRRELPADVVKTPGDGSHARGQPSRAALAERGRVMAESAVMLPPSHSLGRAFRSYEPALDLFPIDLWARVAARVLRNAPRTLYGMGDARGYLPLRRAIVEYLGTARGVKCSANQILITTGAQQALHLVARLLLDPGDAAWMEDPGYPGMASILRAAGARIVPVPVDEHGLCVEVGIEHGRRAKLAYVTPANQFPLGALMSLDRRLALLDWAFDAGAWIIEDDYDSEYRYRGRPVAALQGLDRHGSVIYVGTFTKMLFPSLRLGFVVLPERVADAFAAAKSSLDRHAPTLEQAILAEFILEGHFGQHVRRMRQIYAERVGLLAEVSRQKLGSLLEVVTAEAGMRTVGWLPAGVDDTEAAAAAVARGLEVVSLSCFAMRHPVRNGLILGFASLSEAELRRGVDVLATALRGMVRR